MRSRAAALNLCAWTVRGFESSPLARILTGTSLRLPRPFSASASSVTSAPLSKRFSRSARLTGWVCVRNFSKGIDFFMCGPRSLRIRMWIGVWPPSKPTFFFAPARCPAPLWPRPEVLPEPEPSPRPTRLRGRREPGAGFRLWRPNSSFCWPSAIVDHHQVGHLGHEPADDGIVGALRGLADPAEPERLERLVLLAARAVGRLDLADLKRGRHQAPTSSAG